MDATSLSERWGHAWVSRVSAKIGQHVFASGLVVALLLVVLYSATWLAGGVSHLAASWFCLPIILAGGYLGYRGGIVAGVAASLLAGPLMPLDVAMQSSQPPSLWLARSVVFVIIGAVSAAAAARIRATYDRQLELAEEARDLALRKATMVEMVSREFRSPLSVVSAATHALERRGMVSEEGQPLLEGLSSGTERLVDLVEAVSAVLETDDHGGGLRWDTFSIRALLTRVVDHLGIRDPWSRVKIQIDRPALTCQADPELLYQLLRHLVENAVRGSEDEVRVDVDRPSEELFVFEIRDRGPGIDERTLALASDPFSTEILLDGSRKGIGLGLFAATRLVEVMGGTLEFTAGDDGGTVATATIPATSPEPLSR